MQFDQALQIYKDQRKKIIALHYAEFVIGWDMQTVAAPGSIVADSDQMSVISARNYQLMSDDQFVQAVETLFEQRAQLDEVTSHEIVEMRKGIEETRKIPADEYAAFSELTSKAYPAYVKAKQQGDFEIFRPNLEKIVAYNQKLVGWLQTETTKGYDVLLDRYEPHFTVKQYDKFFDLLRQKLVPAILRVATNVPPKPAWAKQIFPKEGQRQFCEYLRDVMCFDKSRGIMMESEHPFTTNFGTDDVRITNHYHEDSFDSAIFSAIHETGHALYEQQCNPQLNGTLSGGGASMGLHESQSRFFENMVGRNPSFWQVHYPRLQQQFPQQLSNVSLQQFVQYVNRAECSFVRTEADEFTYPLHILLRYEIEKALLDGSLAVKDLPDYWNNKFAQYFGITPPNNTVGVLQDVHWAYGEMGYFPTYALGSAIAAQLWNAMEKDFNVEQSLLSGTTAQINAWLKEHIHQYGSTKYPDEILRIATGESFNPNYYVDYLLKKYDK